MSRPVTVFFAALLATFLAPGVLRALADDAVAEHGTLLRESALVAMPGGAEIARLAAGTTLEVHGRQGLWLLVTAPGTEGARRGWTRLTAVRLGGAAGTSAASAPQAGGFARFSRSITGLLGGLRGRDTRTAHATIGIRGLTPGELQTAHHDARALAMVAALGASRTDAELFAQAGGLTARPVPELAAPATGARQ
ncbi:MAG: hypothetical protein RLW61_11845 [Gammaproteobacteria bacterium]